MAFSGGIWSPYFHNPIDIEHGEKFSKLGNKNALSDRIEPAYPIFLVITHVLRYLSDDSVLDVFQIKFDGRNRTI